MPFITIATFSNAIDAHITKGSMECEGILCFLKDEHTIQANPLYDIALGGIKLQVDEKSVEKAITVLKETGYYDNNQPSLSIYNITTSNISSSNFLSKLIIIIIVAILFFIF